MRKIRRWTALLLTAVLALSLAACGGQPGQGTDGPGGGSGSGSTAAPAPASQTISPTEGVYRDTLISEKLFGEDTAFALESLFLAGGRIYSQGTYFDMEGNMGTFLCSFLPDGSDFRTTDIPAEGNAGYSIVGIGEDGSYYLLESLYSMDPGANVEEEDPEAWTDDQGDIQEDTEEEIIDEEITEEEMDTYSAEAAEDNYLVTQMEVSLLRLAEDGKEIWRTALVKPDSIADEDYYGVTGAGFVEGRGIYVCNGEGVQVYDQETGSMTGTLEGSEDLVESPMITLRDGRIFLVRYDTEGPCYQLIDTEKQSISEPLDIPGSVDLESYSLARGTSSDLLLTNDTGIFSWNIGEDQPSLLCSFLNSNLDVGYVDAVVETGEGELVLMMSDQGTGSGLHYLTPVDPSEIKDKKTITLGCYYMDSGVRSQVVRFNQENESYRIAIRDYSSYDTEDGNGQQGLDQLNADVISGNVPDILLASNELDFGSYVDKGVFEDLTPWLEKDSALKADLLPNVMEAANPFDGTYFLVPSFSLSGLAIKAAYTGEDGSATIDEITKIAREKGIKTENIFGSEIRSMILYYAMELNGADFIDLKAGTCNFDSDSFIKVLEFAGGFPDEYSEEFYTEDFSDYYLSDRSLLYQQYVATFADYNYLAKGTFGAPISLMGFPTDGVSGPAIQPDYRLAMSASAAEKDGVWEFFASLLSEDYQKSLTYSLPIRESALALQAEQATVPLTYVDETGKEVEDEMRMYIGDQEVVITTMTREEADGLVSIIKNADRCVYYNEAVMNIVDEEASAFFSGEKSAADTAALIQNRVEVYISENS